MNATDKVKPAPQGASDMAQIVLTFDNNKHATALFGQFDENLAHIERKLGVIARSRGSQLYIEGDPSATEKAQRTLDGLYAMIRAGHHVGTSDVDGAIRMALAADDQPMLPTLETKSRMSAAQISTRKRTIHARTPTQDQYCLLYTSPSPRD